MEIRKNLFDENQPFRHNAIRSSVKRKIVYRQVRPGVLSSNASG